jgi:hypothetical protein
VEPADPKNPDAPEELEDPGMPGDSDRPDDGERTGLAGGDTDGPGVDPDAADPDAADEFGWVGELVASWVQAAMITRSLAGSALPPTPLRSTK